MGMNPYFSQSVRSEQNLYEDITIESLEIYGQSVYYLPRSIVNENTIFGDDIPSSFSTAHKVSMYIENIEGFDGEGDLFTRFGVEIRDEATFIVARRRWERMVSRINTAITVDRPKEGDLIYLPMTKKLFQIMHVEHEQPFYQLSNLPVYKMRCQLFEYNDEDLDTGVDEIDVIETKYAYTYKVVLNNTSPYITIGDTASQLLDSSTGLRMNGEVSRWSDSDQTLHLIHVGATDGNYHEFVDSKIITINDSDFTVTQVLAEDNRISENEQNDNFSTFSDDFLDFTENNPFGDPENS
jgi:hypothetical protein